MDNLWLKNYILLAFRIDKVVHTRYAGQFVTDYYGPAAWKEEVLHEPEYPAADLVRQAMRLADALPAQEVPETRASYLGKQLSAMETLARKLSGEIFSLDEEMKRCFDLHVVWTPETAFEQAHALYESILPGTGNLTERLHACEQQWSLPVSQMHLLTSFVQLALAETQKRTKTFVVLPDEEHIDLLWEVERDSEAYAGYRGNYHSYVAIDPKLAAFHFPRLLDHLICHEAYPGHHTEAILKEQFLYRNQGYLETSLFLYVSPRCVISEGIAMMAHEMIFKPGEAEQWMATEMYPRLGISVDAALLWQLRQASEMLTGVWGNAAMLLDEGRPEAEVRDYMTKYMLRGVEVASRYVTALQHPVIGRYNLIYQYGQQLMRPWLQGPDREAIFRQFLTQQITPSQLESHQSATHADG